MQNALALCKSGQLVGVFPEGLRGVGKLYRERYRLTHFGRGGFVTSSRTANVPIIPVAIVGAEETHPVLARLTRLARSPWLALHSHYPDFSAAGTTWTASGSNEVEHQDR